MKILVIYNPRSGFANQLDQLKKAFKTLSNKVEFRELHSRIERDIKEVAKSGYKIVVVAGGDGTVNTVARHVVGTSLKLGVVPMGTLNHFAKDLNLPLDIKKAVEVIVSGHGKKVDVAEVNGYVFLNNSSIGIYPAVVRERQRHQPSLGKWPSALLALIKVMVSMRRYHVTVRTSDKTRGFRTPFIFVGNNSYRLHKIGFTNRTSLQTGQLSVYWVTSKNPLRIAYIFMRALLGRAHREKDFESLMASEVTIAFRRPRLTVAFDGEIKVLRTPLRYKSRPTSLHVLTPTKTK